MYCKKCGAYTNPSDKFCPNCGSDLSNQLNDDSNEASGAHDEETIIVEAVNSDKDNTYKNEHFKREEEIIVDELDSDDENSDFGDYFDKYACLLNKVLDDVLRKLANTSYGIWFSYLAAIVFTVISLSVKGKIGTFVPGFSIDLIGAAISVWIKYIITGLIVKSASINADFSYGYSAVSKKERNLMVMTALAISSFAAIALTLLRLITIPVIGTLLNTCLNTFALASVFYKYFQSKMQTIRFSKRFFMINLIVMLIVYALVVSLVLLAAFILGAAAFSKGIINNLI